MNKFFNKRNNKSKYVDQNLVFKNKLYASIFVIPISLFTILSVLFCIFHVFNYIALYINLNVAAMILLGSIIVYTIMITLYRKFAINYIRHLDEATIKDQEDLFKGEDNSIYETTLNKMIDTKYSKYVNICMTEEEYSNLVKTIENMYNIDETRYKNFYTKKVIDALSIDYELLKLDPNLECEDPIVDIINNNKNKKHEPPEQMELF